jgi:hypothetical protein
MTETVAISAQSIKKANRPKVVMTLEIKLITIADFQTGK